MVRWPMPRSPAPYRCRTRSARARSRRPSRRSSGRTPGMFLLGLVVPSIVPYLGLMPAAVVRRFFLWQPLTYMFLHAGLFHLLFNMLALWMFGTELERKWGTRFFLRYYGVSGVGAAATTDRPVAAAAAVCGRALPVTDRRGLRRGVRIAAGLRAVLPGSPHLHVSALPHSGEVLRPHRRRDCIPVVNWRRERHRAQRASRRAGLRVPLPRARGEGIRWRP